MTSKLGRITRPWVFIHQKLANLPITRVWMSRKVQTLYEEMTFIGLIYWYSDSLFLFWSNGIQIPCILFEKSVSALRRCFNTKDVLNDKPVSEQHCCPSSGWRFPWRVRPARNLVLCCSTWWSLPGRPPCCSPCEELDDQPRRSERFSVKIKFWFIIKRNHFFGWYFRDDAPRFDDGLTDDSISFW